MELPGSVQDPAEGASECGNESSGSVNNGEFLTS
jgi:hypothetical protein